jgi:threonine aldolase
VGSVTFSIDSKLVETLSHCLPLDVFVETGTFCGETLELINGYFKHNYSVELSEHYYTKALEKFSHHKNITLFKDDAATALKNLMPQLTGRAVFYWLDAHWCVADATAGETSQCPLLEELAAIKSLNDQSIIIIDDARLFLSAPQKPHEISNWPTFHDVLMALMALSDRHQISVINDCILFFPESIKEQIKQFSHEYGMDWLDLLNRYHSSEAILARVCQENEKLHHLSIRQRIRGIFGYIWRTYGHQQQPLTDD